MKHPPPARPRRVLILGVNPTDPMSVGAFDFARQANWVLTSLGWYGETPAALVRNWDADGFLVAANSLPTGPRSRAWKRHPVVVLNDADAGYPRAIADLPAAAAQAARHFIDRGFDQLAYCWLGPDWPLEAQLAGFRSAVEAAGRTFHLMDWTARPARYARWTSRHFRRWISEQLHRLPRPLGLFLDSYWTGQEVVEACRESGILVPEQVAVIGCYDDPVVCERALVPLSGVDMDFRRCGYEGAALLDRILDGQPPPAGPVVVPPRGVVVRHSSDIIALPHTQVARAVRFIQHHFNDPRVGVPQVVEATGMSATGLKEAFRRHLGCPTGQYLRRVRLERALQLLQETSLPVKAVARACGYANAECLRETLRRHAGQSPRAWRKARRAGRPR